MTCTPTLSLAQGFDLKTPFLLKTVSLPFALYPSMGYMALLKPVLTACAAAQKRR